MLAKKQIKYLHLEKDEFALHLERKSLTINVWIILFLSFKKLSIIMSIKINYKNSTSKNPSNNLVLFVDEKFNIINDSKKKEYRYYFTIN